MDHNKRQRTVFVIVLVLIAGIYGLNAVMQGMWDQIEAQRAEEIENRRREELGIPEASEEPEPPASAFEVPPDTGPDDAPVLLEVYFDSSNECLSSIVDVVKALPDVYGDLVKVDYRDTLMPDAKLESDDRQIGCEAAIFFNGEIVRRAHPGNLTGSRRFQGPPNDAEYSTADVYGAINYILREADIEPPREAVTREHAVPRQ